MTLVLLTASIGSEVAPFSLEVAPPGESWVLTPPSSWCVVANLSGGGFEASCSMAGAGGLSINVTQPSRIAGSIGVSGPVTVWFEPAVWDCELEVHLTGFVHSCPAPYNPPPWDDWSTNVTGPGVVDLSALAIQITDVTGVLPPAVWSLFLVDNQQGNATAVVLSPICLQNP